MELKCLMSSTSYIFPEVAEFEIALSGSRSCRHNLLSFFQPGNITLVRVPARLDVIGGIADYSGSNVCEGTLALGVALGAQIRDDDWIYIKSLGIEDYGLKPEYKISLKQFYRNSELLSYQEFGDLLRQDPVTSWVAYIVGTLFVLLKEKKLIDLKHGMNLALISKVPLRVGIGSSATIEMATLHALNLLLGMGIEGLTLARLGQLTENMVVGAPCGIMDQISVTWGQSNCLTHILCQPDIIKGNISIPEDYEFVGINSMVKHSVAGPAYTNVRIGTFMGRKIISLEMQRRGLLPEGQLLNYLCKLTPEEFETHYRNLLPEIITGEEFLKQYGELEDTATKVNPETTYFVRSRTAHPIYENDRVLKFIDLLNKAQQGDNEVYMKQIGRLMLASHESYQRNCELSCEEVDHLVRIAKQVGKQLAIFGAKITGGGSGGTVAIVAKKKFLQEAVQQVVENYKNETGYRADVFWGSSPGALQYGNRQYRLTY